ncbi:alpha/beta hydrolase family protein [Shimazuella kribbensis]|uniref:alpha/beta hydrolase family protein n=1 Tax=Shimazuella kribbensis TaxID=139808 RepID=UPI00041FEFB4|nr:prolyl oligopeptidase family serine peptidase [Shimazuella kribbensis]
MSGICYVYKRNTSYFILTTLVGLLLFSLFSSEAFANPKEFKEIPVTFESGTGEYKEKLKGTLFIPNKPGDHLGGIVLAHGSGTTKDGGGDQKNRRREAEVFAKAGLVTLIYNKRTKGYDEKNRSFKWLAQDLLSGVKLVQSRPDVNPKKVGVWGVSEGGWVAPLAASQSDAIAFVAVTGAPGMAPVQQQAWNIENRIHHQGVKSNSIIESIVHKGSRVLMVTLIQAMSNSTDAILYDPIPPLRKLKQPFLAIWGSKDRQVPPMESAEIMKKTLARAGNHQYTMQFIEGANHSGYMNKDDGFEYVFRLYPGYAQAMTSWIDKVLTGHAPIAQTLGKTPIQMSTSSPEVIQIHWYDSYKFQLALIVVFLLSFAGYYIGALGRIFKGKDQDTFLFKWQARLLAGSGILSVIGFWAYTFVILTEGGDNVGPVIAGQPLLWILLQLSSLTVLALTIFLLISWMRNKQVVNNHRIRLTLLMIGGILFIPWAIYWKLFFLFL